MPSRLHRKLRKEEPVLTDKAHYLAVASGRLEPYFRALSVQTFYRVRTAGSPIDYALSMSDGTIYCNVYASPLRARADLVEGEHRAPSLTRSADFSPNQDAGSSWRHIKGNLETFSFASIDDPDDIPPYGGWRIDPNMSTELTVEACHGATIVQLARGYAIEPALTAIGYEELCAHPGVISDADRSFAASLPQGIGLAKTAIELRGIAGRIFDAYFPIESGTAGSLSWRPIDDPQLLKSIGLYIGMERIFVNPAQPSWQRDLLWDFRSQCVPIDT